jgi:5'-nucleotidase
VTNDDGYQSPGLAALVAELAPLGEVVVSAPDGNRSGSSHSISLAEPLEVREVQIEGASRAVAVNGSPAAAASFGILALGAERPFDLLVSGINRGGNVGHVAHYSGTVGAAMEGAYRGVPAIAVSQDSAATDFGRAAAVTARIVRALSPTGLSPGVVLNVNVPRAATERSAPVVVARMGGSHIEQAGWLRLSTRDDVSLWRIDLRRAETAPAGTDTAAYLDGKISVAPLRFDWTDTSLLPQLEERLEGVD